MNTWRYCGLAVSLLLAVCPAGAQSSTGEIVGLVVDETGAAVPGAQISVRNVGTGEVREFQTDSFGNYLVPQLLPGSY